MSFNPSKFSIEYLISKPDRVTKRKSELSDEIPEKIKCLDNRLHPALRNITVKLEGISLWRRFHELGTEMIVTKSGRYCN